MNTHIVLTKIKHEGFTTSGRASVFDNNPAHDGEFQFFLNFVMSSENDTDLQFDEVNATPFFDDNGTRRSREGTFVCPYHMKAAMEMMLEHLGSGEVTRLESGMLMNDEMTWAENRWS